MTTKAIEPALDSMDASFVKDEGWRMRAGIETVIGAMALAIALVLLLVAWPRGGVSRSWLGNGGLAITYPAIVLVFLAIGCGVLVTAGYGP